jgi:hypothetical protein
MKTCGPRIGWLAVAKATGWLAVAIATGSAAMLLFGVGTWIWWVTQGASTVISFLALLNIVRIYQQPLRRE